MQEFWTGDVKGKEFVSCLWTGIRKHRLRSAEISHPVTCKVKKKYRQHKGEESDKEKIGKHDFRFVEKLLMTIRPTTRR